MSGNNGCFSTAISWIVILVVLYNVGGCLLDKFASGVAEHRVRAERRAQEEAAERESQRVAQEEAERQARENERESAERARAERQLEQREERLRTFTLKEAPVLWRTYQNLQAEIESQNKKIEELRTALESFGRDPDNDSDFGRICEMRDEMAESLKTMRTKIEDAYLASCKYEATPGRKEYGELMRKALEDGIQEAEAAAARYERWSKTK